MNIFILDKDPKTAAEYHCDKHVIKMILETAQMLCTAHWETGSQAPYRATHKNHPCTKWTRLNTSNYKWLKNIPNIPAGTLTEWPQAMPDTYKNKNVVEAYRQYYMGEKRNIVKWKNNIPEWYN